MSNSLIEAGAPVGSKGRLALAAALALAILALVACAGAEEPPVANAGADIDVFAGYPVTLDGSGSTGVEGEESTHAWMLVSKPETSQAELSGADTVTPTFTPDALGQFVVHLQVNDGSSWSAPATVTVTAKPWFADVTDEAGVAGPGIVVFSQVRDFTNPGFGDPLVGSAWGDYDNDGLYDLHVTQFNKPNLLFRNNGDGTFTDVAPAAGVDFAGMSWASSWGDYDNDGDVDLHVSNSAPPSILYRNNGDGTFTDVTEEAGVGDVPRGAGSAWGDYDLDGDLDLAVACKAGADFVFRNNGDGTFTDVAPELDVAQYALSRAEMLAAAGRGEVRQSGSTWQAFWFDMEMDGDLDLFFAVDHGTNYLYENNGDGTFTEITEEAGVFMIGNGMGVDAGDYDLDGDLDLYVSNFGPKPLASGYKATPNWLYRNEGDGTFVDVASAAGVRGRSGVGWGTTFFDYDLDGDLDLAVANGGWARYATKEEREQVTINLLFRNEGDGTFTDVTDISGFGLWSMTRGMSLADYDRDGDLDVYLASSDDRNYLLRNELGSHLERNWLKIKLRGTESNDLGIGAVVRLTAGGRTQTEQLYAGSSFFSQDASELHFGLGDWPVVDAIEVSWPSRIVQTLQNVQPNQTITITEAR